MEESALLKEIEHKEYAARLDESTIVGVPIWRIVRYESRMCYISQKTQYETNTAQSSGVGKRRIKLFSGFWRFIGAKDLTLFYTFNRLVYANGFYLDKFIDPVIEASSINSGEYAIVDSPNYVGDYPRIHKDHVVSNEVRTLFKQILKHLMLCLVPIWYGKRIRVFFEKAKPVYQLPQSFLKRYYRSLSLFLADYYYSLIWYRRLRPKRVLVVFREGYFAQIAACKKLHIPVAEFQHGITLDRTASFTGTFDSRIDPDYFLVFGAYWKGPQFGMPLDRIINIGWAYNEFLKKKVVSQSEMHLDEVLVISSPEITDAILDALSSLSEAKGNYSFDIRLHPCESYNETQKQKLQSIPNAKVVDNKIDSALVLPTYKYVVGENSSVIYEALSVGCRVGMLNLCGLKPAIDLPGIRENFYVIQSAGDFEKFLAEGRDSSTAKAEFYSAFDSEAFMRFINQSIEKYE